MCKRRKKKCDEIKPRCSDCRRLCLTCDWPPEQKYKAKTGSNATDIPVKEIVSCNNNIVVPVSTSSYMVKPMADMKMREMSLRNSPSSMTASCGGNHINYDDQTQHHGSQIGYGDFNPQIYHRTTVTAVASSGGVLSSVAMSAPSGVNDELAPDTGLISATTPYRFDSFKPITNGSPVVSMDSVPPAQSLSIYIPHFMPQLSSSQDRSLLNHYATTVASILSRRASAANPYTSYILPMAQSNDLVLHCILTLSANHWRKLQPHMGDRGLLHKSRATQGLAGILPHIDGISADIALVCSLLLCMTEVFDGTSEGWKLHLEGTKRLLITAQKQRCDVVTGRYKFLLCLARFLDSATTTSTCKPPLIGDEAAEAQALDSWTATPEDEESAIYGIPKVLFHMVDCVNTLAELRSTRVDQTSEAAFRRHATEIERRINNWPHQYSAMSPAGSALESADDDVLHAGLAFEYAIRLRLHQIVEGYELTDPKVGKYVDGILDCAQKIRYGSPLESCMLFPLVMAGGSCWTLEHRLIVQDRLLVMERTCGFGYVYSARDLIERVWSRRDQSEGTGAIVNWERIRCYEMQGLVVF
ncbi:fungal transcriptional regulatory protein [Pochonia chlamydosporia 170]|uniref:Fungal transcriptional regulatory protein n=1 Tax=Pochonia chlamydosporia 170 TaxID=1380566 RepID=A0A179EWE2_METCM|nr:fungal transcriptional regulatory protein [Pochonia chlamydosporia 170]OAQ57498.2 fungal transcriptional regulatory protein [Pochonia chlamydosporia 170]